MRAYKKLIKDFFIMFFLYMKILRGYYKKKEKPPKRLAKGNKMFIKKKKTKGAKILMSDTEIFLRKKKKKRQYGGE